MKYLQVNGDDGTISVHETMPDVPDENWVYQVKDDFVIPVSYMSGNRYICEVLDEMGIEPIK